MTLVLNGTTGVSAVDGSASTPAIQGNDTNTGMFFPAADTVAVATGGSERVRVDSSGNFGIGTSSPASTLDVVASGVATATVRSTSTTGSREAKLRLNVPSTGGDDPAGQIEFTYGTGYTVAGSIQMTHTNPAMKFFTSTTERARIDSSGNLLVGKTTSSISTSGFVASNTGFSATNSGAEAANFNRTSSDGTLVIFRRSDTSVGTISVTTTATSYNTSSDYRLKEEVQPMTGALEKVQSLKPVTYKWKADGSAGEGFIAHELAQVVPGCVSGEKDAVDAEGNPVYQGVDTSFLVATLTAAIQELTAKLTAAEARIAALEAK